LLVQSLLCVDRMSPGFGEDRVAQVDMYYHGPMVGVEMWGALLFRVSGMVCSVVGVVSGDSVLIGRRQAFTVY